MDNSSDLNIITNIRKNLSEFLVNCGLSINQNGDLIFKNSNINMSKSFQKKLHQLNQTLKNPLNSKVDVNMNFNKKLLSLILSMVKRICKDINENEHKKCSNSQLFKGFLGPQLHEDALKLIIHAFAICEKLSQNTLISYLYYNFKQCSIGISKGSIENLFKLLDKCGCLNEEEKKYKLRNEFKKYPHLRKHIDTFIVSEVISNGLKMTPEQWSKKLYGDIEHRVEMQSIIDTIQSQETLNKIVNCLLRKISHNNKQLKEILEVFIEIEAKINDIDFKSEALESYIDSLIVLIKYYFDYLVLFSTNVLLPQNSNINSNKRALRNINNVKS